MTTESDELRALLREAHETIKDLRAALKEAREWERSRLAKDVINGRIEELVRQGLADYHDEISKAIEGATDAVYARYDKLADIMMGEEHKDMRAGKPTITEQLMSLADQGWAFRPPIKLPDGGSDG